jgi:hypothetical protein
MHGDTHLLGDVRECTVTIVAKQTVVAILGHVEIEVAIDVEVSDRTTDATIGKRPSRLVDIEFDRYVAELAIVIPEHAVAVTVLVGRKQIKVTIAVHVEPAGADGSPWFGNAGFERDIGEFAIIVSQQTINTCTQCHVKIQVAVGVIIYKRYLARKGANRDARRFASL